MTAQYLTPTEEDRQLAQDFCDSIGCTKVHHLRDTLPHLIAKIRDEERRRCLKIVETEEEVPGEPPAELRALFAVLDKIGVARVTVGATKKSLLRRIEHGAEYKCICYTELNEHCFVHGGMVKGES